MRGFLWCQGPMQKGKAKVSWKAVCVPKYEGGLGIRRITDFNKALMVSHIWSILEHRESLWVEWVQAHHLRGQSFWDIPYPPSGSWGWRKLLQLRHSIRNFIWMKLGNGLSTLVWHDTWSDMGPLSSVIQPSEIRRAGFSLDSTVADLHQHGNWLWPQGWLARFPTLCNSPQILLTQNQDEMIWKVNNVVAAFSSSTVWDSLRGMEQRVNWVDVVWFSHCIPRHAFNLWLVVREKLLTQDKILQWSPTRRKNMNMMCCSLCVADFDSHRHLFFYCKYSTTIWMAVRDVAYMHHIPPDWKSILEWLIDRAKSRSIANIIGRLVVAAAAYFVWQERNNRLFANHARPPDILVETIKETVRMRLWRLKFKKTTRVISTLAAWGVHGDYLFQDGD